MKCAVYIRVSTNKEEQKASLSNQKDLFYNFIEDKEWSLYNTYTDVESGTSDNREGLQQLIEDAQQKKFDIILAKELSRLARNGGLSYSIRDVAERNHIHIITLDNAINTLEGNNAMFGLYAWIYEQESQRTSERIKAALRTRAQKGLFKGAIPPYGYQVTDGKLYIRDDQSSNIVQRIFKEYIQGKGFDAIARCLYNEAQLTPAQLAGKRNANDKWHGSTIRAILTNPHYTGDLVQGRQTTRSVTTKVRHCTTPNEYIVIENSHEAIITKEDFKLVQALIQSRKRQRPQTETHLFTNTLFCADCLKGMHYKKNRKGYVCGSYNKYGSKACSDHHIIESNLIIAILNDIEELTSYVEEQDIITNIESKVRELHLQLQTQLNSVNKEIQNIKQQKTTLIRLLADGVISQEDYREVVQQNEDILTKLSNNRLELEQQMTFQDHQSQIRHLQKELENYSYINVLTPEILHRLIKRIEIKADGTARIFYRFSLSPTFI